MRFFDRIPRLLKVALLLCVVQFLIVYFTYAGYKAAKPIYVEDCIEKTIVIQEKEAIRKKGGTRYQIYDGEEWYVLVRPDRDARYSVKQVYEMLSLGEEIDIIYKVRTGIIPQANFNWVLDARNSKKVYLEFDEDYSKSDGLDIFILAFGAVSEGGLIAILITMINWNYRIQKEEKEKQKSLIDEDNTQA